jgi:hypothetical protein
MPIPEQVASLMKQLERVLEDGRPVNDVAPLGSGMYVINVDSCEDLDRVSASPVAQMMNDLVAQVLEFCPGSKGLKGSIVKSMNEFLRFQLPTVLILVPLRSPDLYDAEKVQEYERDLWGRVCRSIIVAPDGGAKIVEELFPWAMDYAEHYKKRTG